MCYSEKLAQANAYAGADGWVFAGFKAVLSDMHGRVFALVRLRDEWDDPYPRYEYKVGKLDRAVHGFHLAASRRGALQAALKFGAYDPRTTTVREHFAAVWPGYKVRIRAALVPERSMGETEHAHAIVLCAGLQPTAQEIKAAHRENAQLARAERREEACREKLAALLVVGNPAEVAREEVACG